MRSIQCIAGLALLILMATSVVAADVAEMTNHLSSSERDTLQKEFDGQGFDPLNRQFVQFQMPMRDVYEGNDPVPVRGWLIPAAPGEPEAAILLDGEQVPITGAFRPADFIADSAELVARASTRPTTRPATEPAPFRPLFDPPDMDSPTTLRAVWLHRLGRDDLAGAMLAQVRRGTSPDLNPLQLPRKMDAWHDFAFAVHSFMVGADDEALFYARRLNREYLTESAATKPADDSDQDSDITLYAQGKEILADLLRRKKDGSFNQPPTTQPALYINLPPAQRVPRLIRDYQDIAVRQMSQPGYADLTQDARVQALIAIGEPAVPALIATIDSDRRLTRSVQFWRDFAPSRTVLSVREAALLTLEIVLQTQFRAPENVGDFTNLGEEAVHKTVARIRAYWEKYGSLPFDARMMAILQDPKTPPEALREAAENLAGFGGEPGMRRDPRLPNPAVPQFAHPTCAEVILAAMDRDLHQFDSTQHAEDYIEQRGKIETLYLEAVKTLGDPHSVQILHRRFDTEQSDRMRRLYAAACARLGDRSALAEFATQVEQGTISLPPTGKRATQYVQTPDDLELREIVRLFATELMPATNSALYAMTKPTHPLYPELLFNIRRAAGLGMNMDEGAWALHPYVLRVLLQEMDRLQPDDSEYAIREDGWSIKRPQASTGGSLFPLLMDQRKINAKVSGRICDGAAITVSELIIGAPGYHPLLKDADSRLAALRGFLDTHSTHLRAATRLEAAVFRRSLEDHPIWILNVHPSDRPATADDVAQGRAIFHLDAGGKLEHLDLPLVAIRKVDAPIPGRDPTDADVREGRARANYLFDPQTNTSHVVSRDWDCPRLLIVQAERDREGKLWYGVLSADGTEKLAADDLTDIHPLSAPGPLP